MHIAVNTRFLLRGRLEGIGRFSDEVLRRMVAAHPEARFSFFFDRPYDSRFLYGPNVQPYVLFPPARHPLLYVAFFEFSVARMLGEVGADVFFSPDGYLSLRNDSVPQVPVFHDLAFEHFPNDISRVQRLHYRTFFPRYARHAAHLLTVSEYTRQDVTQTYGIAPEKISVVYNGASGRFRPQPPEVRQAMREKYAGGQPYFLYVGAIHPRKNLDNLIKAFDAFKERTGHPARLVLTGRMAWDFQNTVAAYQDMRYRESVVFSGYLPDDELARLYAGAIALTYVSRFEGFGLPIVEAMHAETGVICSNTSSMPEVAGPAALLTDPYNVADISATLERIAADDVLRGQLIEAGRLQRQQFTWERTAEKVWDALVSVAGHI